jgi:hypothetical protein
MVKSMLIVNASTYFTGSIVAMVRIGVGERETEEE